MARTLTASFKTELTADNVYPCLFYEGNFDGLTTRLWTGQDNIDWNSQTWLGNGWLHGIEAPPETADIRAQGCKVTLSGIPSAMVSLILGSAQQQYMGSLWMGFLTKNDSRENRSKYSEDYSQASWDKATNPCTVAQSTSQSVKAPDGFTIPYKIKLTNTTSATHGIERTDTDAAFNGLNAIYSCYLKKDNHDYWYFGELADASDKGMVVDLSDGTYTKDSDVTWAKTTDVGNGWYKLEFECARTSNNAQVIIAGQNAMTETGPATWTPAGTEEVYAWGVQSRLSSTKREYLKTEATSQTATASGWTVVSDPYLLFSGFLDVPKLNYSPQASTITISYESRLIDLTRPRLHRYSDQGQKLYYPDDRGFEYMPFLQQWTGFWGKQRADLKT